MLRNMSKLQLLTFQQVVNKMDFDIRLAADRVERAVPPHDQRMQQVHPGDLVTNESGYMRYDIVLAWRFVSFL